MHRNKFHHSLRNVNISTKNHRYRLKAFRGYESVLSDLEEDGNNNASQYPPLPLFLAGAWQGDRNLPKLPYLAMPSSLEKEEIPAD